MATAACSAPEALLVVCLCAAWCQVCNDYRRSFEQLQDSLQAEYPQLKFIWLDIEDEAELLADVEVENFPTLLLSAGNSVKFFGLLMPQPQVLERLLHRLLQEPAGAILTEPALVGLVDRIRHSGLAV